MGGGGEVRGGGGGGGRERCQKGREEQSQNVPEREAWRVEQGHIPSIAFRHPSSLEKGCRH